MADLTPLQALRLRLALPVGENAVFDGWTEAAVNWANQPASTGSTSLAPSPAATFGPIAFDVLGQVQAMYSGTNDGFLLAEIDLELRGEGDVLGDAQSGARSSLRLLRVVADADLIAQARIAA